MIKLSGPTVNATNLELVSLAAAKSYIKKLTSDNDTFIQSLLDSTHRQLYSLLGDRMIKFISSSPYTYLLDGTGQRSMMLPQWPFVTSTVALSWGYVEDKDNTWHEDYAYADSDWYGNPDEGIIFLTKWNGFPEGVNNIRAVFEAGYSSVPEDLEDAVCQWFAVKYSRYLDKRHDYIAQTADASSWQYRESEIPASALMTIRSYERVGQGLGL